MNEREAMKQALEALENVYLGARDEAHYEAITALRQALANEALDRMAENARELGLDYQPVAWRDAAIRLGEELSSVGPNGYYDMSAKEWLDWAISQQPRGKNSLRADEPVACGYDETTGNCTQVNCCYTRPQPAAQWVGLTDEEIEREWQFQHDEEGNPPDQHDFAYAIEQALKDKNT